jgi:hypothetical protein
MDCDREIYETFCKDRFDKIEQTTDKTLDILRGQNGSPGLIHDVRNLKKVYKALVAGAVFLVTVLTVQCISWAWDRLFN